MAHKVVILDDRYDGYEEETKVLSEIGAEIAVSSAATAEDAADLLRDADAVICNLFPMTAELIKSLEKCRVISRYGVGFDNVDTAAAAERGIPVCNVPDYAREDVADHSLALLLGCVRKIAYKDRMIRAGRWNLHNDQPCYRMAGKVIGIVGFGNIGRTFCRKISGFGFGRILVDDPSKAVREIEDAGAVKVDFATLLAGSDYISIHCPLNAETENMFDDSAFTAMKDGVIIINTARGAIVNEDALIRALQSGKVSGAGLDVFTEDPLPADSLLRRLDNVLLSDHAGWYSEESITELKTRAAFNVLEVLKGGKPLNRVN